MGRDRPRRIPRVRIGACSDRDLVRIALEREGQAAATYDGFRERLAAEDRDISRRFGLLADRKRRHRALLLSLLRDRFGEAVPVLHGRRIRGLPGEDRWWRRPPRGAKAMRSRADRMERDAARFYRLATEQVGNPTVKELFRRLALAGDASAPDAVSLDCPG